VIYWNFTVHCKLYLLGCAPVSQHIAVYPVAKIKIQEAAGNLMMETETVNGKGQIFRE